MANEKQDLSITDKRMLDVMDYVVKNKLRNCSFNADFCREIGLAPTHINNVISGDRGFSKTQLMNAGEKFGVDMNFLFGFSNQMFREEKKGSPVDKFREAFEVFEREVMKEIKTHAGQGLQKKS